VPTTVRGSEIQVCFDRSANRGGYKSALDQTWCARGRQSIRTECNAAASRMPKCHEAAGLAGETIRSKPCGSDTWMEV
jgi:hypothetical protein